jgi:hypothetical protein
MKICARCFKEIKKGESYLKVILYENEKITEEKLIHRTCWDMELKQRELMQKASQMLNGVGRILKDQGIEFQEVFNIG